MFWLYTARSIFFLWDGTARINSYNRTYIFLSHVKTAHAYPLIYFFSLSNLYFSLYHGKSAPPIFFRFVTAKLPRPYFFAILRQICSDYIFSLYHGKTSPPIFFPYYGKSDPLIFSLYHGIAVTRKCCGAAWSKITLHVW